MLLWSAGDTVNFWICKKSVTTEMSSEFVYLVVVGGQHLKEAHRAGMVDVQTLCRKIHKQSTLHHGSASTPLQPRLQLLALEQMLRSAGSASIQIRSHQKDQKTAAVAKLCRRQLWLPTNEGFPAHARAFLHTPAGAMLGCNASPAASLVPSNLTTPAAWF